MNNELFTQAVAFARDKKYEDAEKLFLQLLAERLDEPDILRHYAIMLAQQNRFDEALTLSQMAISFCTNHAGAYVTLNAILGQLGRHEEAGEAIRRAMELSPYKPATRWNYALQLLKEGNLKEGWENYKWGRIFRQRHARTLQPAWDGGSVGFEQTLLIWAEQGAGDAIQFTRFIEPIKKLGWKKVIFECNVDLVPLLSTVPGIDQIVAQPEDYDIHVKFDQHVSLMDLPGLLGVDKVDELYEYGQKPYLAVDPRVLDGAKQFLDSLQTLDGAQAHCKRVGVVWKGSKTHGNDINRSIPDNLCFKYGESNLQFFSLQKDAPGVFIEEAHDLGPGLNSWVTTAALVKNMDLILTVDTAVAHLAGALGVPCWIMLPKACEWRWFWDREDSPWYPSVRLYRQPSPGDWVGLLQEVVNDLRNF